MKKKYFKIILIILLLLFIIICFFVYRKYIKDKKTNDLNVNVYSNEDKNKNEENLTVTSATSRYDENDVTVNRKKDKKNEGNITVSIEYLQIDGLIDTNVQNDINNKLKNEAYNLYDKKYLNNDVSQISITSDVTANFANVLSANIQLSITYNSNEQDILNTKYLNYNLIDGSKLKFTDLFINNSPIEDIVYSSASDFLKTVNNANSNAEAPSTPSSEQTDLSQKYKNKNNSSNYTSDLVLKKYKENNDVIFYFNPSMIFIKVNDIDTFINIDMEKWSKYIAIYKKYLTSPSIYKTDNIGRKDLFVFTNKYANDVFCLKNATDNLFVDAQLSYVKSDKINDKVINKVKEALKSRIIEIEQYADKNLIQGIAYKEYIDIQYNSVKNRIDTNVTAYTSTMSKQYYEQNLMSLILEYEKDQTINFTENYFLVDENYTGDSKLINNKNVKVEEKRYKYYYDVNGNSVLENTINQGF